MEKILNKIHYGRGHARPNEDKELALRLLSEGNGFRAIGRIVGVSHQTIMNWVRNFANSLPDVTVESDSATAEVDELCTFVKKKSKETKLKMERSELGFGLGLTTKQKEL